MFAGKNNEIQTISIFKTTSFEFTAPDELKNRYENIPTRNLSPLVLAYVGDAYYHLYIRTRLLNFEQSRVHLLNDFSMKLVSATLQAQAYKAIKDDLTEDEAYVFKRGKMLNRTLHVWLQSMIII